MICFLMIYAFKMQNPILMCQEFYIRIETKKNWSPSRIEHYVSLVCNSACLSKERFIDWRQPIIEVITNYTHFENTPNRTYFCWCRLWLASLKSENCFCMETNALWKKRQPKVTEKFQLKLLVHSIGLIYDQGLCLCIINYKDFVITLQIACIRTLTKQINTPVLDTTLLPYPCTLICPFSTKSLLCLDGFLLTQLFFQSLKKPRK